MRFPKVLSAVGIIAALALVTPDPAFAQKGGGGKGGGGGSRAAARSSAGNAGPRASGGAPSGGGQPRATQAQPRGPVAAGPAPNGAPNGAVSTGRTAVARQGYPGNAYYGKSYGYGNNGYYYGNKGYYYGGAAHYHAAPYYGHPYYYAPHYHYVYPYPPAYYYYPPVYTYAPGFNLSFFWGVPGFYGSYGAGWGFGGPVTTVPPNYSAPYGYTPNGYNGEQPYGGVRIDVPQRDADVFVDGHLVGQVDNFDGKTQQANIEAGPHHIEVVKDGYEPVTFDVKVEPGRTITYRGNMMPAN